MRHPKFSGIFYEGSSSLLREQISECFTGERGPGEVPGKRKGRIAGIIVPHAGYMYSGPCAAWGYKALAEAEIPDVYILLGPHHANTGSGMSIESFEMPFGIVRTDVDLAKKIAEKGTLLINEQIHHGEHSLEVQLPLLQFVTKEIERLKVLQVVVGDGLDLAKAAIDIKEVLMDTGKTAVFVVSTDFMHYGVNYHYVPFVDEVQENIYSFDRIAIDHILKGDVKGFVEYVDQNRITICGVLPIQLALSLMKFEKADLEAYYTSGDVMGNYRNSVSYAAIIFR
ncbi:MAG: AmmeMemoRadiSam system protein B [Nanoarchaeota archaeon]